MSATTLLTAADAAKLTSAEAALIASYRAMNDDGAERLVSLADKMVKRFPRPVVARLSLVRGAA